MQSKAITPEEYLESLPDDRKTAMVNLRNEILKNIDPDFVEEMNYGMLGYVIPHSVYPSGYHCNPKLPLPFLSIGSQKNFIGFYHMGMYADPRLMDWFVTEFPKHSPRKLDMGKGCVRFKHIDDIPVKLLGELVSKMNARQWIETYEENFKRGNSAKGS